MVRSKKMNQQTVSVANRLINGLVDHLGDEEEDEPPE